MTFRHAINSIGWFRVLSCAEHGDCHIRYNIHDVNDSISSTQTADKFIVTAIISHHLLTSASSGTYTSGRAAMVDSTRAVLVLPVPGGPSNCYKTCHNMI